jgi:cytochrome c
MKYLVIPASLCLALASGASLAADAQQLLKEKNCLTCHQLDNKVVGPAYKDVAAKYKSRKDAEAYLVGKIKAGSTGVWGQIPMPPNGTVNDEEAKTLAKFILTVK